MNKGDHVFNYFVKSIENMKDAVIDEIQKVYPQATKAVFERSYKAHIGQIETHPVIVAARVLESLPGGERTRQGDDNSQLFGNAAKAFQQAMRELVRSILNPNAIHGPVRNPDTYKGKAIFAWRVMTNNSIDPSAYSRLLAASRPYERAAVEDVYGRMKRILTVDFPLLGSDIIRTIVQDVQDYDRREKLLRK